MDRIKFLQDALEINQVQAMITSKLIEDIPDDRLTDFIIFRMDFVQPMKSKELITKEAVAEYMKLRYLSQVKTGLMIFDSVSEIKKFCQTYFRNKDLCNGPASYYDYVVIGMDLDGNLVNKYVVENGKYLRLDVVKENEIYLWLLQNQERLGQVDIVPYYETELKYQELETTKNYDEQIENPRMNKLIGNAS